MSTLVSDIRYAIRSFLNRPVFAAVAVLTLALGIGANTAIYSLVQTVLLQPLPVDEPEGLLGPQGAVLSYPAYLDFKEQNRTFEDLIAYDTLGRRLRLMDGEAAALIDGESVTSDYFSTVRPGMAVGRTFEGQPEDAAVAVISYDLWQRNFAGDPAVIGREVTVNDRPITIIGVTDRGFRGMRLNRPVDFWFPIGLHPILTTGGAAGITLDGRGFQWVRIMGRLKPEANTALAIEDLNRIGRQLEETYPATDTYPFDTLTSAVSSVAGGRTGELNDFIWMLYGAVATALLIACANVANLMLIRAENRRREIGIRLAVGANRGRLIRQLLTESTLLALLGGAGGLLVAYWTLEILAVFELPGRVDIGALGPGLDTPVLAFTCLLALIIGLLFGLAPALQASRSNMVDSLKDGAGQTGGSSWLRNTFVVVQIVFSVVLLIGGGLLVQSLQNALSTNLGFEADRVMLASVDLGLQGYDEAAALNYYTQTAEQVGALPGITSATWAAQVPVERRNMMENIAVEGYQPLPDEQMSFSMNVIWADYFRTMGISMVAGRDFNVRDDASAPGAVIINETLATRFWPGQDPVGKRIRLGGNTDWHEIVGVVRTSKYRGFDETPMPYMYVPLMQSIGSFGLSQIRLIARAEGDPASMIAPVRRTMRSADAGLTVYGAMTWQQHFGYLVQPQQMGMTLLGGFSLLAVVLAMVGIYGVIAYSVSRRTREIGVRIALGAQARDVLTMVLRQGMLLTIIGLVIGSAIALTTTGVLSNLLYGISPTDPVTYLIVLCLFALVALLAIYLPARRATRVDPMKALRYE